MITTHARRRRTRAEIAQLDDQIVAVLEEDWPQSVRHVFYRQTDPRLPVSVPKTDHGPDNGYRAVQRRVKVLRETNRIPYHWITDSTRRGYHVSTFRTPGEFLRRYAGLYRADLWRDAGVYAEVWAESRSIAGVIEDDCRDLAVSLYPAGGFASLTITSEAAGQIAQELRSEDRPVHIFYAGDYDPAGVLIDRAIESELRKHLGAGVDLTFHRIAITPEQIEAYDLPTKPRKPADRRALHVLETVEAEAMPAGILRRLLRRQIEALLPANALKVTRAVEESEQEGLRLLADRLGGSRQWPELPLVGYPQALVRVNRAIEVLAEGYGDDTLLDGVVRNFPLSEDQLDRAQLFLDAINYERGEL